MADLNKIVDELSKLTVVEAANLSKQLEEKWGVIAAAPVAAAEKRNFHVNYDDARSLIYGMPYLKWKDKYQKEASKEQLDAFEKNKG